MDGIEALRYALELPNQHLVFQIPQMDTLQPSEGQITREILRTIQIRTLASWWTDPLGVTRCTHCKSTHLSSHVK